MCEGNWSAAEAKPHVVQALIDKEIEQGWVYQVKGGRKEAEARWPSATAVGKLNLVEAPGKDPRLVLDSTICQVNPNCSLPEAVQLPTVSDVCFSFQPSDPHSMWMGASLDFKAAHKQIKVRPKDQGLLLFEFQNKLYGYGVCHFGARFSAYWWQRLGALLRVLDLSMRESGSLECGWWVGTRWGSWVGLWKLRKKKILILIS